MVSRTELIGVRLTILSAGRVIPLRNKQLSRTGRSSVCAPLSTSRAEYQIGEFDQLPVEQRPGSIRTTCRRAQKSCRSVQRDP